MESAHGQARRKKRVLPGGRFVNVNSPMPLAIFVADGAQDDSVRSVLDLSRNAVPAEPQADSWVKFVWLGKP